MRTEDKIPVRITLSLKQVKWVKAGLDLLMSQLDTPEDDQIPIADLWDELSDKAGKAEEKEIAREKNRKVCRHPGCEDKAYTRSWCENCYRRNAANRKLLGIEWDEYMEKWERIKTDHGWERYFREYQM